MSRRLALLLAVAVVGVVAVAPSYAAGRPAGCVTLTDPKGDAEAPPAAVFRPPATPGVDIHSVTLRGDGDHLVGSITVGDMTQQPAASISTRMAITFVLKGWELTVFNDVGPVPNDQADAVYYTRGIQVFDEIVSSNVQTSVSGNTLTMAVPYRELEAIRGKQVRGERLSQIGAFTDANYGPRNSFLYPHQNFDSVHAPKGVAPVLGAGCS
jgi:hypothetical protein